MSDSNLRELERRWKNTGAVEDEALLLLARTRSGDLVLERLELAAHCGHEASLLALGGGKPLQCRMEYLEKPSGLVDMGGQPLVVRALCAVARHLAGVFSSADLLDPQCSLLAELRGVLGDLEEWLDNPGRKQRRRAVRAAEEARRLAPTYHFNDADRLLALFGSCVVRAAQSVATGASAELRGYVTKGFGTVLDYEKHGFLEEGFLRNALRAELVPWILCGSNSAREGG